MVGALSGYVLAQPLLFNNRPESVQRVAVCSRVYANACEYEKGKCDRGTLWTLFAPIFNLSKEGSGKFQHAFGCADACKLWKLRVAKAPRGHCLAQPLL